MRWPLHMTSGAIGQAGPGMGVLGGVEIAAVAAFGIGLIGLLLRRRLPRGLGESVFAFATMVAVGILSLEHEWPAASELGRVAVLCGAFSALWGLAGRVYIRRLGPHGERREAGTGAVFLAWSVVSGVAAASLVAYVLVSATWHRVLEPNAPIEVLRRTGLLVIAGILAGLGFRAGAAPRPRQPAVFLALLALLVWWTSMMIPSAILSNIIPLTGRLPLQPGWWTWTFQMQVGLSVVLAGAAIVQEQRYRARRRNAWPERLDDLVRPYSTWPGYTQTEAVLAGMILLLGVYQLVRAGRGGWQLPVANGTAAAMAGIACLFMAYRRWSPNTAGLGMALVTLAAVAAACALAVPFCSDDATFEYAERMPVLYTAILLALWVMMGVWHWLSRLWEQQLLDGQPWTTAGRMIPYAVRTAEFLAAIGVLVAFRMTLWPTLGISPNEDNSVARIVVGGLAILLPGIQHLREGRRRDSIPLATFAVAFLCAVVLFVFIRLPASSRGWVVQYDAIVFAAAAVPLLILAERVLKTAWRAFSAPLWLCALLILPLAAMVELLSGHRLPAAWVRPAALAVLGLLYGLAGTREHRRAFLVLGAVFLLAAIRALAKL